VPPLEKLEKTYYAGVLFHVNKKEFDQFCEKIIATPGER
jgi:hypothetical protein